MNIEEMLKELETQRYWSEQSQGLVTFEELKKILEAGLVNKL